MLTDAGSVMQFCCMAVSSEDIFSHRPTDDPSVADIIEFLLKEEIQVTAHNGSYSGINFI